MVIKVRFMKVEEATRVGQLIRDLQDLQKLNVKRIPNDEDIMNELIHMDEESGTMLPNKNGLFSAVAIDDTKLTEPNYRYIIGYIMYVQSFSIIEGKQIYMTSFFIEPEYRRQGVGKKLMEFMRIHIISTGNKRVDVPFMNDNKNGQRFYANYGSYVVNEEYQLMRCPMYD